MELAESKYSIPTNYNDNFVLKPTTKYNIKNDFGSVPDDVASMTLFFFLLRYIFFFSCFSFLFQ